MKGEQTRKKQVQLLGKLLLGYANENILTPGDKYEQTLHCDLVTFNVC